jgi:hypothetical protein
MPRSFRTLARSIGHTLDENPCVRAIKNGRNHLVDHAFRLRGRGAGRRLAAMLADRHVRAATFTIAFNSPWVIDLLTQAWARHQPGVPLVVIDNSSSRAARAMHEDICRRRQVPWLPLPANPEWSPNRSHGLALNWTWFNVIVHGDLEFVGFIDHDCIPVAGFDLRRRLDGLDAYGLHGASLTHPEAWNIWPGYCFLRPAAAVGRAVDFKHRIEQGLDTGGGNWQGFFRRLDPDRVGRARHRRVPVDLESSPAGGSCLLLDDAFLHLEGASYRPSFRDPVSRERLVQSLVDSLPDFASAERPHPAARIGPAHRASA